MGEFDRWKIALCTILCVFLVAVCATDSSLECSAEPEDGGSSFYIGEFIIFECHWTDGRIPINLNSNGSAVNGTAVDGSTVVGGDVTSTSQATTTSGIQGTDGSPMPPQPELGWFRRDDDGELREVTADHEMLVKWRLTADDNGVEFVCAAVDGAEILLEETCTKMPLAVPPSVTIQSSPGTHRIGEGNTMTCDAQGDPEIATYEWFVNGEKVFPEHDPHFSGDDHVIVDDENMHIHRHLTFDSLNITDNATEIVCTAWTTTNISSNATFILIVSIETTGGPSFLQESVVLLACLAAGGAPVLFLICVCIIWGIRRSRRKRMDKYQIDYSGSFKSEENIPAVADTKDTSLSRRDPINSTTSNSNHHHRSRGGGAQGTVASAVQRPNFFRQKLDRLSQMFFTPTRYVDDESSLYENTSPTTTTTPTTSTFGTNQSLSRGGEITRGGSLQLTNRPPLSKTMSETNAPMSAPLCGANIRRPSELEQEYENFVPPTPDMLERPSNTTW